VLIDGKVTRHDIPGIVAEAKAHEADGYDGFWSAETAYDPFFPLLLAAEHTTCIQLGTGITVAFGRSPMQTAYVAHDLHAKSGERFILGLGSQVKPHIERRYAMPWSHPAPRMREYISALRAIWASWDTDEALDFRGDFYKHTLMPPFFKPSPNATAPAVHLAAVGAGMTEVAGEVADGMLVHAFSTERYIREVTLPALEKGLAKSGRTRGDLELSMPAFVVTGRTEEELAEARQGTRDQIAFYGSTPAYKGVLELHGWGDLHVELNKLSRSGRPEAWREMGDLIEDDVLHAFAVVAEPDQVGPALLDRYTGLLDRFSFYAPYPHEPALFDAIVRDLAAARR
jgi:probable F420-dependent oxidoreductase